MATRTRKVGDQHQIEAKLELKYDEEEKRGTPARLVTWMNAALGGDHEPCPGTAWSDIQAHYKDGAALCKLINKVLAHAGKPTIGFKAKAKVAFVAYTNIENFNNGARAFGIPETALFQTGDLYEGRKGTMSCVIGCLDRVGNLANLNGFQPQYVEYQAPKADF